jgi:hypothetical protein
MSSFFPLKCGLSGCSAQAALISDPSVSAFLVARITGVSHGTRLQMWILKEPQEKSAQFHLILQILARVRNDTES